MSVKGERPSAFTVSKPPLQRVFARWAPLEIAVTRGVVLLSRAHSLLNDKGCRQRQ